MADIAYTLFLDHVMPDVRGVTPAFCVDAIRKAVIKFCESTRRYYFDMTATDIVGAQASYVPGGMPADTLMWDVVELRHDGKTLDPASDAQLDGTWPTGWRDETGVPEFYQMTLDRSAVLLFKTPADSLTGGLTGRIAVRPLLASTTCPDWILEQHVDAIKMGAFSCLYAMKDKPWTDVARAAFYTSEFNSAVGLGDAMTFRGNVRARLRSRIQPK